MTAWLLWTGHTARMREHMNLHGTRTGRRGIVGQLSPSKGESSHRGLSPCISGLRNYRYLTPYANVLSFPVPYTILPLFLASAFLEKYSGNKRQRRGEERRGEQSTVCFLQRNVSGRRLPWTVGYP
jgi:hypothetical protein